MKIVISNRIVFVIAIMLGMTMSATVADAGGSSLHACVAGSLFPDRWFPRYHAMVGGPSNDFAWFLRDLNLINDPVELHDQFHEFALEQVNWWNFGRDAFALGTATHQCVDEAVDEFIGEPSEMSIPPGWISDFINTALEQERITSEDIPTILPALPAVFDFIVDALFLGEHNPQLQHLIILYRDAIWVEDIVEEFLHQDPEFDVRRVYNEFFFILRVLEKLAMIYGPVLRGEVEISSGFFDNIEFADLLGMSSNLSDASFEGYLAMFNILVNFPDILYSVVTTEVTDDDGEILPAWKLAVNHAKRCAFALR